MTKPNFFVIGSEKCGTTSLCQALHAHPDVFVTDPKEPHFFSNDEKYNELGVDWYYRLYEQSGSASARGEGSVTYSYESRADRVIARIAEHCPGSRFIFSVRHPIERIQSIWRQGHSLGLFPPNIQPDEWVREKRGYLEHNSQFFSRIRPFVDAFGDAAVRVVFLPDYNKDPAKTLADLHAFLGVEPLREPARVRANRTRGTRDMLIIKRLKDTPAARRAFRLVPSSLRNRILNRFRRPVPPLTEQTIRSGLDLSNIREDNSLLFRTYNKPNDYWVI